MRLAVVVVTANFELKWKNYVVVMSPRNLVPPKTLAYFEFVGSIYFVPTIIQKVFPGVVY